MKNVKYIGLDVHQATISIAILDADGKLLMQSVIATQASTILDFIRSVRGELHVVFEEGAAAHRLYGLLKPHARDVMVCDARKSARLNAGSGAEPQSASPGRTDSHKGWMSREHIGRQSQGMSLDIPSHRTNNPTVLK